MVCGLWEWIRDWHRTLFICCYLKYSRSTGSLSLLLFKSIQHRLLDPLSVSVFLIKGFIFRHWRQFDWGGKRNYERHCLNKPLLHWVERNSSKSSWGSLWAFIYKSPTIINWGDLRRITIKSKDSRFTVWEREMAL